MNTQQTVLLSPPPAALPRRRRTGLIAGGVAGGAAVLGGLAFGAVALFGTQHLVTDDVQREIVRVTQDQTGVPAVGLACPEEIPVALDSTITCTGTVDGQPVTYTVRQTDDRGYLWIGNTRFLQVVEVEDAVSAQLGADVEEEVVAVCSVEGQAVLFADVGTPIPCTAVNVADPTLTAEIVVDVDGEGTVTYGFA